MQERPLRAVDGFPGQRSTYLIPLIIAFVCAAAGCDGCDLSTRPDDGGSSFDAGLDANLPDAFFEDVPVVPPERRPYIFQQDEVAPPGRYVSLCGRFLGEAPGVHLYRVSGAEPLINESVASTVAAPITTLTASPTCVQFMVPTSQIFGLYAIWVSNDEDYSSTYYLNRARPYYVEFDAAAQGNQVRIFGMNLRVAGANPTVKLVSGEQVVDTAVIVGSSNENMLIFGVPRGLVDGTEYTVRISNGHGGPYGEVDADVPIRARERGNGDPFGLAVPWAGDLIYTSGVALTNGANVQTAIDAQALAGGGMVRLGAGNYNGFNLKTGVIVKGPDPGTGTATIEGSVGWSGASRAGIMDLTINSTSSWGGTTAGQEKLVIYRITSSHEHTGHVFDVRGVRHLLISDWTQSVSATASDPLNIGPVDGTRPEYIHIRRYRPTYIHGHLVVSNARYVTIDDTTSVRDFARGYVADGAHPSGHWNLEFTHDAAFLAVRPRSVGQVAIRNDGEGFATTGGSSHSAHPPYFGYADPSTSDTLYDEDESFALVNEDNVEYWAFLVDGKGAGQARRVVMSQSTTVTVDPPWDVIPDVTTRYVVQPLDAHRVLLRSCVMQDNSRNIWFYNGGYDLAIVGNTLRNGEIWLRAFEREQGGSGQATAEAYPLWKSYVSQNLLETTTDVPIDDGGREYHRSSHLMVTYNASSDSAGSYPGMYVLLHSFVNNRVQAWPVNRLFDPPLTEGIIANVNDESESNETRGKAGRDADTDPIVGIVFHGNTVEDAATAYQTGTGVAHMVITERRGGSINYENTVNTAVGHGADHFVVP